MQKKLWLIFLLLIGIALVNCGGRGSTEKDEEDAPSDEVVIPKLAITLTFPADSGETGYYDITYSLQNTPKAQGPFTKVAYSKADAGAHELQDISVSETRNISVKIEDANGIGIFKGTGVITPTSTSLTIPLEVIPSEEADPSECAAFTAKITPPLKTDKMIIDSATAVGIHAEIDNPAGVKVKVIFDSSTGDETEQTHESFKIVKDRFNLFVI